MSLEDLEAALSETKAKWKADKSDKKAKKAYKAAKAALAEAKEAAANKKRSAEETDEQPPKKKVKANPSVDDLQNAADAAKKAWKADKSDKSLKKAWKAAKKALSEAQEAAEKVEEAEKVIDIDALKAAVKAAKKLYKEDKSNKENKAAFKAAKEALAEAEAKESEKANETKKDDSVDVLSSLKKKPEPVEPAEELSSLAGLKKGGKTPGLKSGKGGDNDNPPSRRVFMRNLSYDIDDEKVTAFWKEHECGDLTDIFWMTDRDSGEFRGIGIVEFATQEGADKAVSMSDTGIELMGRQLRCNYAKPKPGGGGGSRGGRGRRSREPGPKPEGCDTIFLGNVGDDVTDDKIYELFKECGDVTRIHWLTDKETGDFKGCGFVQFAEPDKALPIAIKCNGMDFCGKTLNVDYSAPRPPRQR